MYMPDRPDNCTVCDLVIQYDKPFVEVDYAVYLSGVEVKSGSIGYCKEHAPNTVKEKIDD